MKRRSTGHVSLVGGGPGDPELLTRKAVARLRGADLVLYDALVDRARPAIARAARSDSSSASAPAATRSSQADNQRADDPRGAPRPPGRPVSRAAIRSCSAAAAKRRWRSAAPASPFEVVPGVTQRRRRACAGGHPGHASRHVVGVPRRERPRRGGVRAGGRRRSRRTPSTRRRADGPRRARRRLRAVLIERGWRAQHAGRDRRRRVAARISRCGAGTLDDLASARTDRAIGGPGTIVVAGRGRIESSSATCGRDRGAGRGRASARLSAGKDRTPWQSLRIPRRSAARGFRLPARRTSTSSSRRSSASSAAR